MLLQTQCHGAPATIGLVEGLLLVAENLPRNSSGNVEVHGTENRQAWMLVGAAIRSASALGMEKVLGYQHQPLTSACYRFFDKLADDKRGRASETCLDMWVLLVDSLIQTATYLTDMCRSVSVWPFGPEDHLYASRACRLRRKSAHQLEGSTSLPFVKLERKETSLRKTTPRSYRPTSN